MLFWRSLLPKCKRLHTSLKDHFIRNSLTLTVDLSPKLHIQHINFVLPWSKVFMLNCTFDFVEWIWTIPFFWFSLILLVFHLYYFDSLCLFCTSSLISSHSCWISLIRQEWGRKQLSFCVKSSSLHIMKSLDWEEYETQVTQAFLGEVSCSHIHCPDQYKPWHIIPT